MNWLLLQNSLLVAGASTLIAVIAGGCVALVCVASESKWKNLLTLAAVIALALPPFLVVNCWLHYLGNTGVWRSWLPFNIYSRGGTIWILALMLWPVTTFFSVNGLKQLGRDHLEVDPLLRGFSLLRLVLLPRIAPDLFVAMVLTFALAMNNFAVPAILQVKVLPAEVWVNFNTTFDYAAALRCGWPLIIVPMLLVLFARNGIAWMRGYKLAPASVFRRQLGGGLFRIALVITFTVTVFSAAFPLVQLLGATSTWTDFLPALQASQSALFNSLVFAAGGATAVLALILLTWRKRAAVVSWIAFLVPGVVLGIAVIVMLNRPAFAWLYQSAGIVVIVYSIRYLAPGWQFASVSMKATDTRLLEAARVEGGGRWTLWRHVYFPQNAVTLAAAWYVTFIFCLWDIEALVLIVPPGCETAALRMFNLLHYGHNSQVNALNVLLLATAILPLGVVACAYGFSRFLKRRNNSGRLISFAMPVVALVCVLTGCSESNAKVSERSHPIQSKLFSHVEIIGTRGVGSGQFNKPRSLALDRDDNLFVVDMTGRVQKFSAGGAFLMSWQMPQTDLGRPKGMGLDRDGNLVVIEPHYSRVNHFDSNGKLIAQWGKHGTNAGELAFPRAVAINSRGEMYLSEYGATERVQHFTAKGETFLNAFGKMGGEAGEFNRPEGICVDAQDRIYVADSCNHRLQVFSPEGKFLRAIGKAGTGEGEFSYPYDVRIDNAGLVFICEFGNSRIQILSSQHETVEILGSAGGAPGQFANPWSIALDSKGNLYVADSQNHRVQRFIRK